MGNTIRLVVGVLGFLVLLFLAYAFVGAAQNSGLLFGPAPWRVFLLLALPSAELGILIGLAIAGSRDQVRLDVLSRRLLAAVWMAVAVDAALLLVLAGSGGAF